ncbi:hypothetical protein BC828DRAFT_388424 [Blastocladiella britannica]|nr:hypothetical protein BC828DRAFT_388424 [Blastocladiella britannica]
MLSATPTRSSSTSTAATEASAQKQQQKQHTPTASDSDRFDENNNNDDMTISLPRTRLQAAKRSGDDAASAPTSAPAAATAPLAPASAPMMPSRGPLPKHMLARVQAGSALHFSLTNSSLPISHFPFLISHCAINSTSSPTDKIMSPVTAQLSGKSEPKYRAPGVGDLAPLFAKAKVTPSSSSPSSATPSSSTLPAASATSRLGSRLAGDAPDQGTPAVAGDDQDGSLSGSDDDAGEWDPDQDETVSIPRNRRL